jgi:hypothetical protein
MKTTTWISILALAAALFLVSACSREALREPSPSGPSTAFLTFSLTANPNVLYASTTRPVSKIRAVIREDNKPLQNAVVYFSVMSGPGYFSDYSQRTVIKSDENGVASVSFYGPLKSDIDDDVDVVIRAQLETSDPYYMHKEVEIHILRAE